MFEGDEGKFLSAESGLEFFAVLEDVFASIPVGEAEVQDFATVEVGDAAGSGAKAMEEPGEFGKEFELQNF